MSSQAPSNRWYPTESQLKDPASSTRVLKQVLDQFYTLQTQHQVLQRSHDALLAKTNATKTGPPPGSGPADSMLLGLPVQPTDVQTLANGATLRFNKVSGNFSFQ